jgi:hypothetical protein
MTDDKKRVKATLIQARTALDRLDARAVELVDRDDRGGSAERDGYPSATGGDGGGGRSADRTSSVERTAGARVEWGAERQDGIHDCAKALRHHLDEAVKHLHSAVSQVALAEHLGSWDGRHSNPPTDCLACGRTVMCTTEDPIRSGYCSACSSAFYRWKKAEEDAGRPVDRSRFEQTRRQVAA